MDTEEQKFEAEVDAVTQVIESYLDEVGDWDEVEVRDLAENIVGKLRRAER